MKTAKVILVALIFLLSACTQRVEITSTEVAEAEALCDVNGGVDVVAYERFAESFKAIYAHVKCANGAKFYYKLNPIN